MPWWGQCEGQQQAALGGGAEIHGEKVQVGGGEFGAGGREFGETEVPVEPGRVLVGAGYVQVHSRDPWRRRAVISVLVSWLPCPLACRRGEQVDVQVRRVARRQLVRDAPGVVDQGRHLLVGRPPLGGKARF
jgi:hypothetical protein